MSSNTLHKLDAKRKVHGVMFTWIVGLILTVGGILVIVPFVWMIFSTFKTESEVMQIPPTLFPHDDAVMFHSCN